MSASQKIFLLKLSRFLYERISTISDFLLFLFHAPVSGMDELNKGKKTTIVYLGEYLPPRIPRLAKWVKRNSGFSTVLICSKQGYVEKFSNQEFDAVFLFRNVIHLKRIISQMKNIYLIHAFAPKSYFPEIIRRNFKHKFICDYQDVYSNYYGLNPSLRWLKKELPYEQSCLAHADGIVAQSLEPNAAFRKCGVKKKPTTIFFPLYCDDDVLQNKTKKLDPDNIHIVYAGAVAGSHRNPKQYGNTQFHGLIEVFSKQKIHFHIYPSPSNIRADYEEYEEMAQANAYFHFHDPIPQNILSQELSKYHFGILPFFLGDSEQEKSKFKFATTLKLFNYIEAGIPVLVSKDVVYQSWIVERYQSGIVLSSKQELNELGTIIRRYDYSKLQESLLNNRDKLTISRNITRVLDFYNRIAAGK